MDNSNVVGPVINVEIKKDHVRSHQNFTSILHIQPKSVEIPK